MITLFRIKEFFMGDMTGDFLCSGREDESINFDIIETFYSTNDSIIHMDGRFISSEPLADILDPDWNDSFSIEKIGLKKDHPEYFL